MSEKQVHLLVWGDFACFTRPELKVERVSYPLMTPSAARGVLEAVYWEPQFYYLVDSIKVVRHSVGGVEYGKGKWLSLRRNEVQSLLSLSAAKKWMNGTAPVSYIHAGGGAADATQRNTLALQHVAYLISATIRLSGLGDTPRSNLTKCYEHFQRRASSGKCFHRPCLGCREFAADFEWVDDPSSLDPADWPDEELGWMLYDVFDPEDRKDGFIWVHDEVELPQGMKTKKHKQTPYAGKKADPSPVYFYADIRDATLNCRLDEIQLLRARREEAS